MSRVPRPRRLVSAVVVVAGIATVPLVAGMSREGTPAASAAAETPGTTPGARLGFSEGWSIMWEPDAEQTRHFDAMAATGARWIRLDFDWASANPSPGTYNWATIDRAVAKAHARGMSVIALAAYTPAWARPGGTTDKHPPTDPNTYATFVGAAAARYAPQGVKVWEIWNEPNIPNFWAPNPNVAAYTALLKLAYSAIKARDASTTVLTAGTSPATDSPPSYVSPLSFLNGIYANGGKGSFDAVGHHPYCFPYSPLGTQGWNAFNQTVSLRNAMVAQGDGAKQIWGTEFGAPTGTNSTAVTEAVQATTVSEAIGRWNAWTFTGPLIWYSYRDAGTDPANREDNFGLVKRNFSPKAGRAAFIAISKPPGATTTTVPPTTTTTAPTTTTTAPPPPPPPPVTLGSPLTISR